MPYTAAPHERRIDREALRARIPGWGADLDPLDRPSGSRELRLTPEDNGAHWERPERQPELYPRERSIEHGELPPVFGTVAPLRGLSGAIRRYAYAKYSEGRAAHWLLLVLGDRVDAVENHVRSFATLRPDNPITETGVLSEPKLRPISSRVGQGRTDGKHAWMDPLIVAGPWVVAGIGVALLAKGVAKGASAARTNGSSDGRTGTRDGAGSDDGGSVRRQPEHLAPATVDADRGTIGTDDGEFALQADRAADPLGGTTPTPAGTLPAEEPVRSRREVS